MNTKCVNHEKMRQLCDFILFFVLFLCKVIIMQANKRIPSKYLQKEVDAFACNPHNAPRNADEGHAKKMAM
ncbi:MAG: hypothetical protein RR510_17345 [Morganella sp. (in: enterobacteria)]